MLGGRKEKATMSDKHNNLLVVLSDGETYDNSATVTWMPKEWPAYVVEDSLRKSGPGTVTVAELVKAIEDTATLLTQPDREELELQRRDLVLLLARINAS
jgi:hypothetical protein